MNYTIKPEEHELREARNIIQGSIEAAKTNLALEEDIRFSIGWNNNKFVNKNMKGVVGNTWSESNVLMKINTSVKGWKNGLKLQTFHEYAHLYFYQNIDGDLPNFNWQDVLIEAQGQIFAEKMCDVTAPWRDKVDTSTLEKHWDDAKKEMSSEIDWDSRGMFRGNEIFPHWYGYSLSYRIGKKLLENNKLEEFPGLKRSDVIEAGDQLFG